MNYLAEKLETCCKSDVLWLSPNIGSIDSSILNYALSNFLYSDWYGKRVAIGKLPVLEFVLTLLFLDGIAESILILPLEENEKTIKSMLMQSQIEVVIENDGLGLANFLMAHPKIESHNRTDFFVTKWILPTSGTTGIPKLVPHTFGSLTRSMSGRKLGDMYVWGSLYSLRRFAGLQVFLQAWLCSNPLILIEEDTEQKDAIKYFSCLGCNALSATPSMWRKIAMYPVFDTLALKQITLGGEIVDQTVLDMLAKKFPNARITHIYASTEVGVGFSVHDKKEGFPVKYLSDSPAGIAMRVDEKGHLWLRPKEKTGDINSFRWIDSGDVVVVGSDRVRFWGRANGSINVGGNKVMPEEVEAVIREMPEVAFVQVRARKSTMLGSLVEAAITPINGLVFDADFKRKVLTHCRNRLNDFKVPAFIVEANQIKLSSSGKLLRTEVE